MRLYYALKKMLIYNKIRVLLTVFTIMIFGAFIASTAILILREKIAEQNLALEKKTKEKTI